MHRLGLTLPVTMKSKGVASGRECYVLGATESSLDKKEGDFLLLLVRKQMRTSQKDGLVIRGLQSGCLCLVPFA